MKKQFLFIFFLMVSVCMRAQFSGKGSGTTNDPYLITTANELNQTRNNLEACYKLMRDIDLTEWLSENNPSQGWMPIGAKDEPFKGTFDGNGKTVKLFINRPDQEYVGFMGVVDHATIKNLTVKGNITGKTAVGGIIGYCDLKYGSGDCEIENCHYVGNVNGGGIVGWISFYESKYSLGQIATIKNCSFTGKAKAGIVYSCGMVYIQGCKVNATIESEDHAGGIIGIISPGKTSVKSTGSKEWFDHFSEVHDCSVSGHIKGKNAGGIVGSSAAIKIYNNLVTADVEGTNAGGVLGERYNNSINEKYVTIIKNVIASTEIKGTNSVGRVSGTQYVTCGNNGSLSTNYVINGLCVYLDDQKQTISDSPINGEICGKSVLAESATYEGLGWDMRKTWGMSSVTDLPYLLCMGENAGADDETASPDNYDNTLMLGDLTTAAGKEVVLPIKMKNTCDISAYQFDLYLPEGFTVAVDEDGMEKIEVGSRTTSRRHVIDCAKQKDGSLRVIAYSMKNYNFENSDGDVAKITINVPSGIADGMYNVVLKNIVLSTAKSEKFEVAKILGQIEVNSTKPGDLNNDGVLNVADVTGLVALVLGESTEDVPSHVADLTGDGKIQVNDVVALVNLILSENVETVSAMSAPRLMAVENAVDYSKDIEIEPFTIQPGEEKTISVLLNNVGAKYTGWQADFHFPAGIEPVSDEDVYYIEVVPGRTTTRLHTIASAKQKDGSVRVMSYSMKNALFKGEHGAVAEITVKAAGDLKAGTYQIKATNVVLSGKDAVAVYPPVTVATALAGNGGEGALALVGSYDEATLSDFSDALSANTSITSVNLKAAYNVEQASLTSGNPNMLVFVGDGVKMNNVANVVENGICANLKLDENYAYSSPFAFTAQQATFNRSFTAGKKSTVYLPFSVDNPQSYGTFFAFERYDAEQGQVYFQEASQLAANTAYVFKPTVETLTFANVEVATTPANQSEVTEAGLYGTFVPVTTPVKLFDGMNVYGYAANDIPAQGIQAGQFVKAGNKVSVASFRSFLALPALQSPRSVGCLFSGETTGIDSVVKENGSDVLYNLKGQRVNQAGKGMYIKNGKKVIVK